MYVMNKVKKLLTRIDTFFTIRKLHHRFFYLISCGRCRLQISFLLISKDTTISLNPCTNNNDVSSHRPIKSQIRSLKDSDRSIAPETGSGRKLVIPCILSDSAAIVTTGN